MAGLFGLRPPMQNELDPGVSTLGRLVELTREVDFAAFVFADDDGRRRERLGLPREPDDADNARDSPELIVMSSRRFG